jgi:hypothetical protein
MTGSNFPQGVRHGPGRGHGHRAVDREKYGALQQLGELDTRCSDWLATPPAIRALGGAIYGDRRNNRIFIGHNGTDSEYGGRGCRCPLTV